MAILNNTMMLGTSAVSDDAEPHQIEKSLRFTQEDQNYLERVPNISDTRSFTISAWFKRTKIGTPSNILGNYNTTSGNWEGFCFYVNGDDQLELHSHDGSSYTMRKKSHAVLKDSSAWYHAMAVIDTTNIVDKDRVRIYLNGERITQFNTEDDPGLDAVVTMVPASQPFNVGYQYQFSNALLADVYYIDGLVCPSAFGQYTSAGAWIPKNPYNADGKLILPTPNQNVTHSSTMVSSTGSWYNSSRTNTQAFDGVVTSSGTRPDSATASVTWTPATEIPFKHSVQTRSNACTVELTLTDDTLIKVTAANDEHKYLYYGNSKIKSIKWTPSGSVYTDIQGIWVDGVLLKDGEKDVGLRTNPNDGTVWSSGTATGTPHGAWANLFDGSSTSVAASGNSGGSAELTLPAAITWTEKLRVFGWLDHASSKIELTIDGTTTDYANLFTPNPAESEWETIATTAGSLTKIKLTSHEASGSNNRARLYKIEADGHIVLDSVVDNSFNLNFSDVSNNYALGYDSLSSSDINHPNKSGPILKTKPTSSGKTLDSGTNTDANASSLVLAIPCNSATDVHHTVKGSGSAKTITYTAGAVASTEVSRYYGTSTYLDGSGARIVSSQTNDCTFAGECTVEGWFFLTESVNNSVLFWSGGTSGDGTGQGRYLIWCDSSKATFVAYDGANGSTPTQRIQGSTVIKANRWYHIAFTRNDSNVVTLYLNGVSQGTWDSTNFWTGANTHSLGGQNNTGAPEIGSQGGGNNSTGYFQDFRFYTTCKYTANFVPQAPNDFVPTRLNAKKVGTVDYSADVTGSAHAEDLVNTWDRIFDGGRVDKDGYNFKGSLGSVSHGNSFHLTWTPATAIPCTTSLKVRHYARSGVIDTLDIAVNDGSDIDVSGNASEATSDVFSGVTSNQITKIKYHGTYDAHNAGGEKPYIAWIEVDGTKLEYIAPYQVDSSVDSPTNYEPLTGSDATGEVTRGNYCTVNPLAFADWGYGTWTLSHGNLVADARDGTSSRIGCTMGASSGKWYWEAEVLQCLAASGGVGIAAGDADMHADWNTGDYAVYLTGANKHRGGTSAVWGNSWDVGDVMGIQWDADNGAIYFWKNGTIQESGAAAYTGLSGYYVPILLSTSSGNQVKYAVNFGQRPFKYTNAGTNRPSTDYKCLCNQNLPDLFSGDELNNPSKYVDTKLYSGDGTATQDVKGLKFQPDLVWQKIRNQAGDNALTDAARGTAAGYLQSEDTAAETGNDNDGVSAFLSDGFTAKGGFNSNGNNWVGWCWDAGTAAATASTDGSITPSAQWVNATAGFSISKFTGTGSAATVGHALGAKPDLVIIKNQASTEAWQVWIKGFGTNEVAYLDTNDDIDTSTTAWNNTAFTNTLVHIGANNATNKSSESHIMYAWTAIPGYSAFGYYTGSGVDPNFVNLGFSPHFLMVKPDIQGENWIMWDSIRKPYNEGDRTVRALRASGNDAETTYSGFKKDFFSNGFNTNSTLDLVNKNATKFYYAAFAELPFKTSRAR